MPEVSEGEPVRMKEPEQLSIAQLKQMNGQPVRYGITGEMGGERT